jgi:hypothetical protein
VHREVAGAPLGAIAGSTADGAPYDYVYERARKVSLSADILSIELSAAKRNTVSKAEVKTMFNRIAAGVRRRLLTLQSELPGELVGRTEAEIERIVSEQIEQTLGIFQQRYVKRHGIVATDTVLVPPARLRDIREPLARLSWQMLRFQRSGVLS